MTWQHLILYSVIVLWGLPAARQRWSAMLILSGWAVTEVFARASGIDMPFRFEMLVGAIVVLLMLRFDRHWVPMAIFLPLWCVFYAKEAKLYHDYYVWHAGWALQIVQILLTGRPRYLPEAWSALNDMVRTGAISRALSRNHPRAADDCGGAGVAHLQAAETPLHSADAEQCRATEKPVGVGR